MQSPPEPEFLRIREVLRMLGVSRSTLWRWIRIGDFPAPVRLGGPRTRAVAIRRTDIERWINSRQSA